MIWLRSIKDNLSLRIEQRCVIYIFSPFRFSPFTSYFLFFLSRTSNSEAKVATHLKFCREKIGGKFLTIIQVMPLDKALEGRKGRRKRGKKDRWGEIISRVFFSFFFSLVWKQDYDVELIWNPDGRKSECLRKGEREGLHYKGNIWRLLHMLMGIARF